MIQPIKVIGIHLSSWVLNNETGREITARFVPDQGGQTVIQFSAATVDWSDTVDLKNA